MKNPALIIILLLPFLTGCGVLSLFKKENDMPIIPPGTSIHLDPRALESCKPLVKLNPTTLGKAPDEFYYDVLENQKANALLYRECAKKHEDNILLLKKISNKEKPVNE